MSANDILLIIVSGLGTVHGLFLAFLLWGYKKGRQLANRLLSLLLLVLSFRVGKSVFLEFAQHLDIKLIFTGLASMMAIGPLFWFFIHSCARPSYQLTRKDSLHFIPFIVGLLIGIWLEEAHAQTLPLWYFAILFLGYYAHLLTYLISSLSFLEKLKKEDVPQTTIALLRLLLFALFAIWGVYVLNLIEEIVPYILGPILYTVIAYTVGFIVIHKEYLQKIGQKKYSTTSISSTTSDELLQLVLDYIQQQKGFQDPNLTLKGLSARLKVSPQQLSMVINQQSGKNFNQFVNTFRVEEAKRLLQQESLRNHTIAAIAMEVGFNSISSFNTHFKKQVGQSPTNFRNTPIE